MKIQNRTETGHITCEWQDNCFSITKKPFTAIELVESTPLGNIHRRVNLTPRGFKSSKNQALQSIREELPSEKDKEIK